MLLVVAALAAGCGQAAAVSTGGSPSPQAAGTIVAGRGISVTVPDGWVARVLPGRVQIQDYPGHGDPAPGQVQAFLDEYSRALAADDAFPYPELAGRLVIMPGEYPSAQFAKDAAEGPGITGAVRFFTASGRLFELFARYGGAPPPTARVAELNEILATLKVRPGDFYPGRLDPPTFTPAQGWHVGGDGPIDARPEGDQLCAWASTIPYRDPQNCPSAAHTIDALPPDGMVISVNAYRSWSLPTGRLPETLSLSDHLVATGCGGQRGLDIQGMAPGGYYVEINVNVATDATLTQAMRGRAQAMVDGLHLPAWPP